MGLAVPQAFLLLLKACLATCTSIMLLLLLSYQASAVHTQKWYNSVDTAPRVPDDAHVLLLCSRLHWIKVLVGRNKHMDAEDTTPTAKSRSKRFWPEQQVVQKSQFKQASQLFVSMAWACKHIDAGAAGLHLMKSTWHGLATHMICLLSLSVSRSFVAIPEV